MKNAGCLLCGGSPIQYSQDFGVNQTLNIVYFYVCLISRDSDRSLIAR